MKLISEYSGEVKLTGKGYPQLVLEDTEGHKIVYRFYDEYAGFAEGLWKQNPVPLGNEVPIVAYNQIGAGIIRWH